MLPHAAVRLSLATDPVPQEATAPTDLTSLGSLKLQDFKCIKNKTFIYRVSTDIENQLDNLNDVTILYWRTRVGPAILYFLIYQKQFERNKN